MTLLILLLLVSPVYGDLLNSRWEGLKGLWNLQEGGGVRVEDQSGNGAYGEVMNSASWVTGSHGNALSVGSTAKWVNIQAGSSTWVVSISSPFSVGGVFNRRPNANIGSGDVFMSNRESWPPGSAPGWHVYETSFNSALRFGIAIGGGGTNGISTVRNDIVTDSYNDGRDHTFIVTYNGGNCIQCSKIYVDGEGGTQAKNTNDSTADSVPVAIENAGDLHLGFFQGTIEFVGNIYSMFYFNRVLSPGEVKEISNTLLKRNKKSRMIQ